MGNEIAFFIDLGLLDVKIKVVGYR